MEREEEIEKQPQLELDEWRLRRPFPFHPCVSGSWSEHTLSISRPLSIRL